MTNLSSLEKKYQKLEAQKIQLQKELNSLSQKRNEKILDLLSQIPSADISIQSILGGLIDIIKEAKSNLQKKEEWHKAGEKFCNTPRSKRSQFFSKAN